MMYLVSRYSARGPNVLASAVSESPGENKSESQVPLSSWNDQQPRTGRLRRLHIDDKRSSQEWKSDELMEVRTGRLVYEQPPGLFTDHMDKFIVDDDGMDSDTVAESDMSFLSRSFLHRVNDQVRKRQNQSSKDATKDSDKRSMIWRMFMSSTLQTYVFIGKNYSDNLHSIKNTEDLTMKQMFGISEKLKSEQSDDIF